MKKLLSIALLATLGFSANITVIPYGSYINYSNKALKDNGTTGGAYISCFKFPFKLEIDAGFTNISYKSKYNIPDWNQKDLTAVAHFYQGANWDIKAGIHNIYVDQDNNPDSYDKVLFGGILYYEYGKYNIGADYYRSYYDNDFHVNQYTLKAGFTFGDKDDSEGLFYTELKMNFIHLSKKTYTNKDNYSNAEIKVQNFKDNLVSEIHGSIGKNAYKVANDGFAVYNLGEEYKYTAGAKITYIVNNTMSVGIGFDTGKYTTSTDQDAYSNIYSLFFSKKF